MKSCGMMTQPALVRSLMKTRRDFISICLLCLSLITGCFHGPAPYRPKSWIATPIDQASGSPRQNEPLLQIIIVYGPAWCHHTALRLECPDRPVLFWDPGGSYGVSDATDVRSKDLIRVNPPDLKTYLQFAWKHSSKEVEVFEWDLKLRHALEMYDVLLYGTGKDHPAGKFTTLTLGLFCSVALSDFLHRFAKETLDVPRTFFFPHDLARVLYTQSPNRVLVFRRGNVQKVYFPP